MAGRAIVVRWYTPGADYMPAYTPRDKLNYTIPEAEEALGCKRSFLYDLMSAKKLDARKLGSKTVITAASLRAYAESLPVADIRVGQPKSAVS